MKNLQGFAAIDKVLKTIDNGCYDRLSRSASQSQKANEELEEEQQISSDDQNIIDNKIKEDEN